MLILMTPWDARACVVTHTAHPFALQAISQLPAEIGFLGVLVCCSRRFAVYFSLKITYPIIRLPEHIYSTIPNNHLDDGMCCNSKQVET